MINRLVAEKIRKLLARVVNVEMFLKAIVCFVRKLSLFVNANKRVDNTDYTITIN